MRTLTFVRLMVLMNMGSLCYAAGTVSATINKVSLTQGSFNPSVGQKITIGASFFRGGRVSVVIVDRDGFSVRTLAAGKMVTPGDAKFEWDGCDDAGVVVADEVYSPKITWSQGKASETYFPADGEHAAMQTLQAKYYDRHGGTLAYTLAVPSRVHIQAGTAVKDTKGTVIEGPVMKTIVDRAPRVAGSIAEYWTGFDESGSVFLPDLPDFVVAIAATPLSENSIIVYGNRKTTFISQAMARKGTSLYTRRSSFHMHHAGLSALDDVSPQLEVTPLNATWSKTERLWILSGQTLRLKVRPIGPTASAFVRQPATVLYFVDQKELHTTLAHGGEEILEVPRSAFAKELGMLSVNWRSEYGPVAANTIRIRARATSEVAR
jgi:hypothetical protein